MNFQTPEWVCKIMVGLLPKDCNPILEPTPGEGNLVRCLTSAGFCVYAPDEFWDVRGSFGGVVMNPPFTPMSLGYKILYRTMELSDRIIALMPWLTIINSERRTMDILSFGLREIVHLPRNAFPGSRVQTCVLSMERGYFGEVLISFAGVN